MTLHSCTKLKYCRTDVPHYSIISVSALKYEIDTTVGPFHEKNNNVKPTCHKNLIREGIIDRFSLFKYFPSAFLSIKRLQTCLLTQLISQLRKRQFRSFELYAQILAHDGMVENR